MVARNARGPLEEGEPGIPPFWGARALYELLRLFPLMLGQIQLREKVGAALITARQKAKALVAEVVEHRVASCSPGRRSYE